MKKLLTATIIVASTVGMYLTRREKKKKVSYSKQKQYNKPSIPEVKKEPVESLNDKMKKIDETKYASEKAIHDRHVEAASIMADAYKNIMEEMEPINNFKDSVEIIIDSNDDKNIKDLDSMSAELDELLK